MRSEPLPNIVYTYFHFHFHFQEEAIDEGTNSKIIPQRRVHLIPIAAHPPRYPHTHEPFLPDHRGTSQSLLMGYPNDNQEGSPLAHCIMLTFLKSSPLPIITINFFWTPILAKS